MTTLVTGSAFERWGGVHAPASAPRTVTLSSSEHTKYITESQQGCPGMYRGTASCVLMTHRDVPGDWETILLVCGLVAKANFFVPPHPLTLNRFRSHTQVVSSEAGGSPLPNTAVSLGCDSSKTVIRRRQVHPARFPQ